MRFATLTFVVLVGALVCEAGSLVRAAGTTTPPHLAEHVIKIDPTALYPPAWWEIPGHTPMIMTLDPDNTDAYRTTQARDLKLKPGRYQYRAFTFDFPFTVTIEGVLDFPKSLDQCVQGRGTTTLKVLCGRTQPYGGQPDYKY